MMFEPKPLQAQLWKINNTWSTLYTFKLDYLDQVGLKFPIFLKYPRIGPMGSSRVKTLPRRHPWAEYKIHQIWDNG